MTTAVVLFATAGGIIPPLSSAPARCRGASRRFGIHLIRLKSRIVVAICGCTASGRSTC